jgi:hypothetical protein
MHYNDDCLFFQIIAKHRALETFLKPHLSFLDLKILAQTCRQFNQLVLGLTNHERNQHFKHVVNQAILEHHFNLALYLLTYSTEYDYTQLHKEKKITNSLCIVTFEVEAQDVLIEKLIAIKHKLRLKMTKSAALNGNLPLFKIWMEKTNGKIWKSFGSACASGHLETVQYIYSTIKELGIQENDEWGSWQLPLAARNGHLKLLQWFKSQGFWCKEETGHLAHMGSYAAQGGHKNIIDEFQLTEDIAHGAAAGQQWELLKWALSQNNQHTTSIFCLDFIAKSGNLTILKEAYSLLPSQCLCCIDAAIKSGNIDMVRWLISQGYKTDEDSCPRAAERGHLEMLKYLHSIGCAWGRTYIRAVEGGLDVLIWCHENGCPQSAVAFNVAAEVGSVTILQWLYYNVKPIILEMAINDAQAPLASSKAAEYGHIQVLKWLKEKEFQFDKHATFGATFHHHKECLEWLIENNYPWHENCRKIFKYDKRNRDKILWEWMDKHGCPDPHICYS